MFVAITKGIIGSATAYGAGGVARRVLQTAAPIAADAGKVQKALATLGEVGIAGAAGAAAGQYMSSIVDDVIELSTKIKNKIKFKSEKSE